MKTPKLDMLGSKKPVQCIFCDKRFPRTGLASHIRWHINEKCLLCQFCSEECGNGHAYKAHIKIYHPAILKKKLTCYFCDKHFTIKSEITSHLKTHSGETPFSCGTCLKQFSNRYAWKVHTKRHLSVKIHECDLCSQKFAKLMQLRRHKTSVHERAYCFVCPLCQKRFNTVSTLRNHIKTHTNERHYTCTICKVCYKRGTTLKQHYLREHSGVCYNVHCKVCGVEVPQWHLRTHLADHTKPHKCSICGKGFSTKYSMEYHQKLHSNHNEQVFVCVICKKAFDTRIGKMRHEKRHSSQFPCRFCGKVLSGLSSQIMHMRRHSEDKRVCVFCEISFVEPSCLRAHILQHVEEKPWLCNMCPYEGRQSCHLKIHKRRHHSDLYEKPEKNHACSMCDMKFRWKGNLIRHIRFHTGEKPYHCKTCKKRYAEKLTLENHEKKHHPELNNKE